MSVSALDHYVHQIVKIGIVKIYVGDRLSTPAYGRLRINVSHFTGSSPSGTSWLEEEIDSIHGHLSFQNPDKIADAIRLIYEPPLWSAVADVMGTTDRDIKLRLKLIVDRRNKIAHEADIDPTYPGQRWPISRALAENAIDTIEQITTSIHMLVAQGA